MTMSLAAKPAAACQRKTARAWIGAKTSDLARQQINKQTNKQINK
jgi:hypothetical protein